MFVAHGNKLCILLQVMLVLHFRLPCVVMGLPDTTPYYHWCFINSLPQRDFGFLLKMAFEDLIQAVPMYWNQRKFHYHEKKAPRGKYIKIRGRRFFDTEDHSACEAKINWIGGCRETGSCQTMEDCTYCLQTISDNLVDMLCPKRWKGAALALDCFAHFVVNGDLPTRSVTSVVPFWPPLL